MREPVNTVGKGLVSILLSATLLMTSMLSILLISSSCAPNAGNYSATNNNSQSRMDWATYKTSSPFKPIKMWALSLPKYGNSSPSCVSDKIFTELDGMIAKAEGINASIEDQDIHQHIEETVAFWREIIREQPALKQRAEIRYSVVEQVSTEVRDHTFDNSSGSPIARGHIAGIAGLGAALVATGPVEEVFRPHVARYAPRALELAKRERELDRRFHYGGDPNHLLDKNIVYLEEAVSEIRN